MTTQPDTTRDYTGAGIVVHWRPGRCIHSGNCVRALPQVFRPQERPWIAIDAADADALASAVERCPSGALSYTRQDAEAEAAGPEAADNVTPLVITVMPDGPNVITGDFEIRNADGELIRRGTKVALCRCGASRTKPYCDGSHELVGFTDPGPRPR